MFGALTQHRKYALALISGSETDTAHLRVADCRLTAFKSPFHTIYLKLFGKQKNHKMTWHTHTLAFMSPKRMDR